MVYRIVGYGSIGGARLVTAGDDNDRFEVSSYTGPRLCNATAPQWIP